MPDVPDSGPDDQDDHENERFKAYIDAVVALAPELDQDQRDRLLLLLRRALQREGPAHQP